MARGALSPHGLLSPCRPSLSRSLLAKLLVSKSKGRARRHNHVTAREKKLRKIAGWHCWHWLAVPQCHFHCQWQCHHCQWHCSGTPTRLLSQGSGLAEFFFTHSRRCVLPRQRAARADIFQAAERALKRIIHFHCYHNSFRTFKSVASFLQQFRQKKKVNPKCPQQTPWCWTRRPPRSSGL